MATSDLTGSSPKFRALLAEVEKVGPGDSADLIQGETGTGKLESELFGHGGACLRKHARRRKSDSSRRTTARCLWMRSATPAEKTASIKRF